MSQEFINSFEAIQKLAANTAKNKGWDDKEVPLSEFIALCHSEISEGLEWGRKGNLRSDHIPKFLGLEEELADTIIRIMHYAYNNNLRISEAVIPKMEFNNTRPMKHGGKLF